ncbi:hypothetical protein [Arthrobacter sp. zg-Y1116]|uniref:hypothetical protein n=1 Tax=Arthrobacter sp. zg-Y1116 TaxID=2964611 RepID=UPI00210732B1|nr:hypothetical protein [Arthrobacter sp. zg-Y1116]MCQ1947002.1 hypothetical protein [Arthrobacter sp. zg-Y1116]
MSGEGVAQHTVGGVQRRHAASSRSRRRPADLPAAAGLVLCALILWSLLTNVVDPHYGISRYRTGWALLAAASVPVLMAGLYWLLRKAAPLAERHRALTYLPWAAVWVLLLILQLRVAYAVRLPPDWDAHAIADAAAGLAGKTADSVTPYFETNPNNLLLVLLVAAYYEFALSLGYQDLGMITAFLNGLVLFTGTVLTYCAVRMLGGRTAAAVSLVPTTVFLVLSPWAGVLYSDTAGVLFTVLILCLLLASRRSARLAVRVPLWILAGAVAAVGYGIKPTVLICVVAAGITAVCLLASRKTPGVLILAVVVVGGSFFIGNRLIAAFEQQTPVIAFDIEDNPRAMNPGHFLKVGAGTTQGPHGPYYGTYNEDDYQSTVALTGEEEKFRQGVQTYAERVSSMGPGGYVVFLHHKLAWFTGDGSFFSWGEGVLTGEDFLSSRPADQGIQDLFGNTRPNFHWLLSLWQGTWFAVLALVAVPLFLRTPRLLRPELSAMRIALLGLLLFLLLFEARARFLYLYAPYFIVLASLSFTAVMERLQAAAVRSRVRSRPRHAALPGAAEVIE